MPLGRTIGIGANGAVSNLSPVAEGRHLRPAPRAAPQGRLRRRPRPRAAGPAGRLERGARQRGADRRHLPRLLDQGAPQLRRHGVRRPPHVQPPLGADRRLRGRRLDRAALVRRPLRDRPQRRRRRRRPDRAEAALRGAAGRLRRPRRGAQGAADPAQRLRRPRRARALPADRDRGREGGRPALPRRPGDDALHRPARPRLRRGALAPPARRRRALRALALRRELRHGPHRGLRRRHARDRLGDRRLQRRRQRRRRRRPRAARATRSASPRSCSAPTTNPSACGRWGRLRARAPSATPGRGWRTGSPRSTSRRSRRPSRSRPAKGSPPGPGCGPPTAIRRRPLSACRRSTRRWPGAAAAGAASPGARPSASPPCSASA